jgi:hypothetical protein
VRAKAWDGLPCNAAVATKVGRDTTASAQCGKKVRDRTCSDSRSALKPIATTGLYWNEGHCVEASGSHAAPFGGLVVGREPLELRELRDARKFAILLAHQDSLG